MTHQTTINKSGDNKLIVVREFNGTPEQVFKAWTDSSILDQWWAPKPWKASTKTMDFREGGHWLYNMEGPEGEKHWARMDYETIDPNKSFTGTDAFCDEEGNKTGDVASMHWRNDFTATPTGTKVTIEITFANEADLQQIAEMGFKEGFTAAHGNLDEVLGSL